MVGRSFRRIGGLAKGQLLPAPCALTRAGLWVMSQRSPAWHTLSLGRRKAHDPRREMGRPGHPVLPFPSGLSLSSLSPFCDLRPTSPPYVPSAEGRADGHLSLLGQRCLPWEVALGWLGDSALRRWLLVGGKPGPLPGATGHRAMAGPGSHGQDGKSPQPGSVPLTPMKACQALSFQ